MEDISEWQKFKQSIRDVQKSQQKEARPWHVLYKENYVEGAIADKRLEICSSCPEFIKLTGQCKKCGCVMKLKTLLKQASCPIGHW